MQPLLSTNGEHGAHDTISRIIVLCRHTSIRSILMNEIVLKWTHWSNKPIKCNTLTYIIAGGGKVLHTHLPNGSMEEKIRLLYTQPQYNLARAYMFFLIRKTKMKIKAILLILEPACGCWFQFNAKTDYKFNKFRKYLYANKTSMKTRFEIKFSWKAHIPSLCYLMFSWAVTTCTSAHVCTVYSSDYAMCVCVGKLLFLHPFRWYKWMWKKNTHKMAHV